SVLWLFALAALTALFSILNTGLAISANGGSMSHPTSASLVSFLLWVCLAALLAMLVASMFDPHLGVAMIVVSVPVIVYRVGLLVAVHSKPTGAVVVAIIAFATTTAVAVSSAISLRHLQVD
ncbi:MAG: hypothetical protein QOK39_752, partial [Acidimicrobiaceae bacterium]|nr:hypothetical protein [Acidimicrobiaceae bacterium]